MRGIDARVAAARPRTLPGRALCLVAALLAGSLAPGPVAAQSDGDACPADQVPSFAFADVSATDPHAPAIDCVVWWGIAKGSGATTYGPGQPVTRAQMATFVSRVMVSGGHAFPASPPDAFVDDDTSPHEGAIDQLAAAGVVGGTGPGTYSPSAQVTREQMATFLIRAYELTTGVEVSATRDHFTDDDTSAHEDSINAAAEVGIAAGTTATTYAPTKSVARNQMATFIVRVEELLVDEGLATLPFGPGTLVVPDDLAPGLYRNSDSSALCYWERLSGFSGDLADVIASGAVREITLVEVRATDAGFYSQDCGTWAKVLAPRTTSRTAPFGGGAFQVGFDIDPGQWTNAGATDSCYWERLSGFSGEPGDVIASDAPLGPVTVTIEPGDVGFYSEGCGTWSLPGGGEDGDGEDGGDGEDPDDGDGEDADCFGCVTLTEVILVFWAVPGSNIPQDCLPGQLPLPGGLMIGPNVEDPNRNFTYAFQFWTATGGECDDPYTVGAVGITRGNPPIYPVTATPLPPFGGVPGGVVNMTATFRVPEGNFYEGPLYFYVSFT